MDPNRFIKVTGVDLRLLIAAAYDLSKGGEQGPIPEQTIDDVMGSFRPLVAAGGCALSIDSVLGREVKLNIWKSGDDLYIDRKWEGHTDDQVLDLLDRVDVSE